MADLDTQAIDLLRSGANRKWYGLYRGRIEDIDDPDRLSRVKVRVWAVHGDKIRFPKTALPWAEVADEGGGGYDFGSFDPFIIGSSVWVGFEMGNPDIPVVLGGFRGEPIRDEDNPNLFLVDDKEPPVETSWAPPNGELETPKDIFDETHNNDPHPTRRVWKKSYKGHTILAEDGDGLEFLKIIDRSGQILEFDCAVTGAAGGGNAAQRGVRDSVRGDQLSHDAMVDRYAHIRLRDLSGQELILSAQDRDEFIQLRSRNRQGSVQSHIKLMSGLNNKGIELKDSGGNFLRFDPDSNESIRIQDLIGNAIVFDKDLGAIKLICTKTAVAEMPQQNLTVSGKREIEVKGDDLKKILGNKKVTVSNDDTGGVMGNVNYTLGGSLKISVTNAAPSGSEKNAIDISIGNPVPNTNPLAAGSHTFKLSNQYGDMIIDTLKGDVELSTLIGDATLGTLAGDVNLTTLVGDVDLSTLSGSADFGSILGGLSVNAAGISNLYGTVIRLGSPALAVQPLLKGTVFGVVQAGLLSAFQAYITGIQATADPPGTLTSALSTAIAAWAAVLVPGIPTSVFSARTFTE